MGFPLHPTPVTLSNPPVVAKFTTEALTGELLPLLEKAQGLLGATIGPDFRAGRPKKWVWWPPAIET